MSKTSVVQNTSISGGSEGSSAMLIISSKLCIKRGTGYSSFSSALSMV